MSEALSIKRRKSSENETSFESLKSEAIKLIHQVSGKLWTDYNLHDPGITILEQLIYAITDISYRTEFPVKDYLLNEKGEIDYESLGLHSPVDIFPSRATTIVDYRKILLDAVSEITNIFITPEEGSEYSGLYHILVKLDNHLDEESRQLIIDKIRAHYNSTRNLCEDLAEIEVIKYIDYELCAKIEVNGRQSPVDILANIYFSCSRCITGSVTSTHLNQLVNEESSLDELFSGPFTKHGFLAEADLVEFQQDFSISSFYSEINNIEGVDHIQSLYLEKDNESYFDNLISESSTEAFSLMIPQLTEHIKVVLSKNGRVLPIDVDELISRYKEINFKYQASRATPQEVSQFLDLPKGVSRDLSSYSSIQNQFPAIYGINSLGVPKSSPTDVKAKARQLKSYLVIFEQLMTNQLANLDSINTLYSKNKNIRRSYSFNLLDNQQIADLDLIYPDQAAKVLKGIINKYDHYNDRKSRLLDYLLALYGERFTQNSLRHFNYYYSNDVVEDVIVNNKINFLSLIVELGRDRAAAADYSGLSGNNGSYSGLQMRVSMLLGFEKYNTRSMTKPILREDIKLLKHSAYEKLKVGSEEFRVVNLDDLTESDISGFEDVPLTDLGGGNSIDSLKEMIGDAIPLNNQLLSDVLLRGGIDIDRYKIVGNTNDDKYRLLFHLKENQYWHIGTYVDEASAHKAANALREFFLILNKQSEGLHVIEHILLRPQIKQVCTDSSIDKEDFFSFKLSIIFPTWTARCYDKQFRKLAEETVCINVPAHLYPEFYWLNFRKMYELEIIYGKWIKLKTNPDSNSNLKELDECSNELIDFLLNCRNNSNS